jgi:hypothetical protein
MKVKRGLKSRRNNCYKNGKKISCKNKIFKEHFKAIDMMNNKTIKSEFYNTTKRCYINKKEVSCKNKIFK